MDFSCFFQPDFNQKQWINNALDLAVREQNVDRKASELALELHVQMKDAMLTVDRSIQDAIHSIPRILREVESLRIDAVALGSELQSTTEHLGQVQMDSQATMNQLIELDHARRNAQLAANALRETARWSELLREVDEIFDSKDSNQLCVNIEGMENCLTALTHLPDYKERLALVETHKNNLESLLAPQLMQAFNQLQTQSPERTQSSPDVRHLIDLFYRIGRGEAAVNYFTSCLKAQIGLYWDQCSASDDKSLNLSVSVLQTMERLAAAVDAAASEFGQSLPGVDGNRVEKCRKFTAFVAQVVNLSENQLKTVIFPSEHHVCVIRGIAESILALQDRIGSFVSSPCTPNSAPSDTCRVDVITSLLRVAEAGYSALVSSLQEHHSSESDTNEANVICIQEACDELARAMVTPFKQMSQIFTAQCQLRFKEDLEAIKLTWDNPTDVTDAPSTALFQSMTLLTQASKFCLEETHGICFPPLLDLIQTYWEGLTSKWLAAIEHLGKQLINVDTNTAYNRANFFTSALQLSSITGELSTRADMLVDNLLLQSADKLSGLLQSENLISRSPETNTIFMRQLALIQSDRDQEALRCLANSGHEVAHSGSTLNSVGSHSHSSHCRLSAVHRANVRVCRATVAMVRRVALAPMRRLLVQVPQLPVWSATPSSGECTLPNLAYLPQDYMTQIGQYLLALPESFEPYMGTSYPTAVTGSVIPEAHEDLVSSRGLAECLRLGDSDSVAVGLSSRLPEPTDQEGVKGATQRKRLTSLSHMSGARKSGETPNSAALSWLETLISGVACDLLVSAVLEISARLSEASANMASRSDSTEEVEDVALLTEHGAKQLQVDLDYFRNLLDDLGLPLTGSLKALCELIQCPAGEFADLSASRPPRIVNAVAKLRGI